MKKHNDRLLKEYVKALVKEDMGGHGAEASVMASAGVGMGGYAPGALVSHDVVKRAIFDPFIAPFKVFASEAKQIMSSVKRIAKVVYNVVGTTLIPFMTDSYAEIEKEDKANRQKIKNEYKAVYDGVYGTLLDNDFAWTAFLMFPGAFMTAKLALDSPKVFKQTTSILTGGSYVYSGGSTGSSTSRTRSTESRLRRKMRLIKENDDNEAQDAQVKAALKALASSPEAQSAAQAAKEYLMSHLDGLIEAARESMTSDALATAVSQSNDETSDLIKSLKEVVKKVDVKNKKALIDVFKKLGTTQKDAIANVIRKSYAKKIEDEMKAAVQSNTGVDKKFISQIQAPYKQAIETINGLAMID